MASRTSPARLYNRLIADFRDTNGTWNFRKNKGLAPCES